MSNGLEKEIKKIKERNKRVEVEKAWETSFTRRALISVATYIIISLFLLVSGVPAPWLNALVPTLAFVLSTVSLPFFKEFWKRHIYQGGH